MVKKEQTPYRKRKGTAPSKKNVKNLDQDGKKLATLGKRSWFNQNVFWDEIEERITKRKILRPEEDIDFQIDSDSYDGIYNASGHSPYVVVDLKLLEAVLAKARCHVCWAKLSLEQDLDQRQCIGAHLKSYRGSIMRVSVNFNSTDKQGQFSSGITQ